MLWQLLQMPVFFNDHEYDQELDFVGFEAASFQVHVLCANLFCWVDNSVPHGRHVA